MMVRDDRYKYMQYHSEVAELFDVARDPREVHSLAADPAYAAVTARLRSLLIEHFLESAASRARASRAPEEWHRVHQRRVQERMR